MATRATLHRHEDCHGVQEWVETEPAPELGPWIVGYTGYREEADAPVQRLETPSGGAVLVLSFGDPLIISQQPGGTGLPTRPAAAAAVVTSFAGGISDRPALTAHAGRQHGVQVRLGPLAVYALFGVPLDELEQHPGGVIGLAELEGSQQYLVKTFGFIPGELHRAPDGTAVHGEVTTGSTTIWMHRVAREHGLDSPKNLGCASGQLVVYVDDVDAHHRRVTAAGGRPTTPAPVDQAYGLRDYSVFDNEGHLWTFATPL